MYRLTQSPPALPPNLPVLSADAEIRVSAESAPVEAVRGEQGVDAALEGMAAVVVALTLLSDRLGAIRGQAKAAAEHDPCRYRSEQRGNKHEDGERSRATYKGQVVDCLFAEQRDGVEVYNSQKRADARCDRPYRRCKHPLTRSCGGLQ